MAYHPRTPDEEVAEAIQKLVYRDMMMVAQDLHIAMTDNEGFASPGSAELADLLSQWAEARMQHFRERTAEPKT